MELELNNVLSKLERLQIDIRKLGIDRRQKPIGIAKLDEAKVVYNAYLEYKKFIQACTTKEIGDTVNDPCDICLICEKIDNAYQKILDYCDIKLLL